MPQTTQTRRARLSERAGHHVARRREHLPRRGGHAPGRAPRRVDHPTVVLVLCCLAQFMVVLDVSVVNVALPAIGSGLHFSEADLQWVVNAYTVTFAGFMLLGGRAADLMGRRRVFVAGLVLFALASLGGGLADGRVELITARAIQGLGAAVIAPASLAILTTSFRDGPARNRAVGIWGAMGGAGGAAGVLLGGALTELSWRWILFINVPIGILAALAAFGWISESRREDGQHGFDLTGALSATIGLSLLVLGIVRTDQTGWGDPATLGLLAIGVLLMAGFVVYEGRFARSPLMPLRIWSSPTLRLANIIVCGLGAAAFSMWFFLSLYLQEVRGYSPIETGLAFLPMTLLIVIASTVASRLVQRVGSRPLLVVGMLSLAAGLVLFQGLGVTGSYWTEMFGPSLLAALGIGLSFTPAAISGVAGVARQEAGLASGLVNTSRMFGGALGLAILATLAASRTTAVRHGGSDAHVALTSGFHLAFLVAAGMALAGGLLSLRIPGGPARARAGEAPIAVE